MRAVIPCIRAWPGFCPFHLLCDAAMKCIMASHICITRRSNKERQAIDIMNCCPERIMCVGAPVDSTKKAAVESCMVCLDQGDFCCSKPNHQHVFLCSAVTDSHYCMLIGTPTNGMHKYGVLVLRTANYGRSSMTHHAFLHAGGLCACACQTPGRPAYVGLTHAAFSWRK